MANLTQLRLLENLNAFLLVDKPSGIAFSTVIKVVKRKFNLVKVGHAGSLDTAASGLMVLLINDANKYVSNVMGADREYEGRMRLGVKTDTHDINGRILSENDLSGDEESKLRDDAFLKEFKGDVFQTESRYCSVKKEGSATYEVADTGEHSAFMAHVYRFDMTSFESPYASFELKATKGLIVRTLVNDIGEALGCSAALDSLRRKKVGKFSVEDAIAFEKLLETDIKDFSSCVIPLSEALR
jgi:tRNA pseudouridine55 synthase